MSRLSNRPPRRAFSVLELLLALSLAGVVLLSAGALTEGFSDANRRVVDHGLADDRRDSAEHMLRGLFLNFEPADSAPSFKGASDSMTFSSWCDTALGWKQRCTVDLRIDTEAADSAILVTSEHFALRWSVAGSGRAAFSYLRDAARGGTWNSSWGPAPYGPLAVRLIVEAETLILRIGERR
jgi:hypothetical protein